MTDVLEGDVQALRAALARTTGEVHVTLNLPRKAARKVLALPDAERTSGAVVVPARELQTTIEAAALLGVSRPTLMKHVGSGEIDHVMVGSHHRIDAAPLAAFEQARRERRAKAAADLAAFSNEIGLDD
ncbi:helix-turn-helix domain-containing protein [Xylanimonas protaetiae]|uniref:DNA-binding protein n=1 Tax=Xylanimonas protaetiae TaxID=2509457 RepID=A0A4P6F7D2_9MICO|nr:helix-turn-helix domain-containing protein [Xylanimonas protaetiae]QAY71604.1 DNA-binding protein [Xylanimonas protaetiae]